MQYNYVKGPCPTCGSIHNKHVSFLGYESARTICSNCLLFVRNGNAWGEKYADKPPLRLGQADLIDVEIDHAQYLAMEVTPLGLIWWQLELFGPPVAPMDFPSLGYRWVWPHAESARRSALSR